MLVAFCCVGGECDKKPSSPPPPDPWPEKARQFQAQLKQNEDKLRSDMQVVIQWRKALLAADKGDLDADLLAREIEALTQKVRENAQQLRSWSLELSVEANRRGIKER